MRRRLVAALLGLLAFVSVLISGVTLIALHGFLAHQRNTQVREVSAQALFMTAAPPLPSGVPFSDGSAGPEFLHAPGLYPGTVGAQIHGGHLQAGVIEPTNVSTPDETGRIVELGHSDGSVLARVPIDGQTHTLALGLLGQYRFTAVRVAGGDTLVVGLPWGDIDSTLATVGWIEAGIVLIGLVVTGTAGAIVIRRLLRPLGRVTATARAVGELPLDRGEIELPMRVPESDTDPRTEVGQVGHSLNHLLNQVAAALAARHDSEMRVRRFVADASHELRTPLTAIRGYAEVVRRGDQEVPPDVSYALGRVESESDRMTLLVEDLLLLARLDSGRPLAREEVDVSRLLVDVVNDAHMAGPEHAWRLDLPDEPITALGDGDRLHQVVANLLSNARNHTPPGTTVTARLRTDTEQDAAPSRIETPGHAEVPSEVPGDPEVARHAEITVIDDGPGITRELLPRVFDRFSRGDSSRSREVGSSGLGLAIVAAVVADHGGTVYARSEPGHTEFTVRLPCRNGQDSRGSGELR